MPLYEYECQNPKCMVVVEVIEKTNKKKYLTKLCDHCGCALKRIMSKNTFKLKGGGWTPKSPIGNDFDPECDRLIDECVSGKKVR